MATFAFTLQGTTPTTVGATDVFKFAGPNGFIYPIITGTYNSTTHVASSVDTDLSTGNAPFNSKYLTTSTVDLGAGSIALNTVSTATAPIKVNFAHGSAVEVTDAIFYAYDGSVTTNAPTNITTFLAEVGDTNWTEQTGGSATPIALTNSASATSHNWYLTASVSPDVIGALTACAFRIELTYS